MFETVVSAILTRVLGDYVQNLRTEDLHLGLMGGDVELMNLVLKPTALDKLNLPIQVTFGVLGALILKIPWTSLKSSSCVATIKDLFLVVRPKRDVPWDQEKEDSMKLDTLRSRLNIYETVRAARASSKAGEEVDEAAAAAAADKQKGWTGRMVDTILNNIEVHVENVHIRYEDTQARIIFGVVLDEISIRSCDSSWNLGFVPYDQIKGFMYKLASLKNLAVYANYEGDGKFMCESGLRGPEMKSGMREILALPPSQVPGKHWLVHPISGTAKVRIQMEVHDLSVPKYDVDLELESIRISLNDFQYASIMKVLDYVSNYGSFERFRQWKPAALPSVSDKGDWWRYLLRGARRDKADQTYTFAEITVRKRLKDEYIALFKRVQGVSWLPAITPDDQERFDHMELELGYATTTYFRDLAHREIEKEEEIHQQAVKKKGFFGRMFGGVEEVQMSDDQRAEMFSSFRKSVLGEGEEEGEAPPSVVLPDEFVQFRAGFNLQSCVLSLSESEGDIASVKISGLASEFNMSKQMEVTLNLREFVVSDLCSEAETTLPEFRCVVKRHILRGTPSRPLAEVVFIKDRLDGTSDMYLDAKLDHLDVSINFAFLRRVAGFFSAYSSVNLSQLQELAKTGGNALRDQAQAQLQMAIEKKQVRDLHVEIKAPRFLFPHDVRDAHTWMVAVDLGALTAQSMLEDQSRRSRTDPEMYERYAVSLRDFQILFCSFDDWVKDTIHFRGSNNLLEKVGLDLQLERCIVPPTADDAGLIVRGDIPTFELNVSPKKLEKVLMLVSDVLKYLDDPTGKGSKLVKKGAMNLTVTGVDPPILTSDWLVELRSSGHLYFFDISGAEDPDIVLDLNRAEVERHALTIVVTVIRISLPQAEGPPLVCYCQTQDIEGWIGAINDVTIATYRAKKSRKEAEESKEDEDETEIDVDIEELRLKREAVQMMVDFTLGSFAINVSYDYRQNPAFPVTRFNLATLKLAMIARKFDQKINVSLKSFGLDDLIDPRNRHILSPKSSLMDVMTLSMLMASEKSPEYSEKGDMVLDVRFEDFQLMFDPKTLSHVVYMGFQFQEAMEHLKSRARVLASADPLAQLEAEKQVSRKGDPDRATMYIDAEMTTMELHLVDYGQSLAVAKMAYAKVQYSTCPNEMAVAGCVDSLELQDVTQKSIHHDVLQTVKSGDDDQLLSFRFISKNHVVPNPEEAVEGSSIFLRFGTIRATFLMLFVRKLTDFFSTGALMDALASGAKKAGEQALKSASKAVQTRVENPKLMKVDVALEGASVVVPVSHADSWCLEARLDDVTVVNHAEGFDDVYDINLTSMEIFTDIDGDVRRILPGASLHMWFSRALKSPFMRMHLELTQAHLFLSHEQYKLVFQILDRNVGDPLGKKTALKMYVEEKTAPETDTAHPEETQDARPLDVIPDAPEGPKSTMLVEFECPEFDISIVHHAKKLASLTLAGMVFKMKMEGGDMDVRVELASLAGNDLRDHTNHFKHFVVPPAELSQEKLIVLSMDQKGPRRDIRMILGELEIAVLMDLFMDMKDFFLARYDTQRMKAPAEDVHAEEELEEAVSGTLHFTHNTWLAHDLVLSGDTKMIIEGCPTIVIEGEGHSITLAEEHSKPIIVAREVKKVYFRNLLFRTHDVNDFFEWKFFDLMDREHQVIYTSTIDGCWVVPIDMAIAKVSKKRTASPSDASQAGVSSSEEEEGEGEAEAEGSTLVVHAELRNPIILLPTDVENEFCKQFRVRVLAGLSADFEMGPGVEKGIVDLKGFGVEAFSVRYDTVEPILHPVHLHLELNNEDDCRDIQVRLLSNFMVKITYQDVKLMTGVIQGIIEKAGGSGSVDSRNVLTHPGKVDEAYSHVVDDCAFDSDSDFSDSEEEEEGEDEFVAPIPDVPLDQEVEKEGEGEILWVDPIETFQLVEEEKKEKKEEEEEDAGPVDESSLSRIRFDLDYNQHFFEFLAVDNVLGFEVPLIRFRILRILCAGDLKMGGPQMMISAGLLVTLLIDSYNQRLSCWEPLLEPWNGVIEYSVPPKGLPELESAGEGEEEVEGEEDHEGFETVLTDKTMYLKVACPPVPERDSEDVYAYPLPLNLTITESMLQTINTTKDLWMNDFGQESAVAKAFEPFLVRNHSGFALRMWVDGEGLEDLSLPSGEAGYDFRKLWDLDESHIDAMNIWFDVDHFEPVQVNVRAPTVDAPIDLTNDQDWYVRITVEHSEGRKVITLHSGIAVVNETSIRWTVGVRDDALPVGEVRTLGELVPGDSLGIPFRWVDHGQLCVQPTEHLGHGWSIGHSKTGEMNEGMKFQSILRDPTRKPFVLKCPVRDPRQGLGVLNPDGQELLIQLNVVATPELKAKNTDTEEEEVEGEIEITRLLKQGCRIALRTPLTVENLLGLPMQLTILDRPRVVNTPGRRRRRPAAPMKLCDRNLAVGEKVEIFEADPILDLFCQVQMGAFNSTEMHLIQSASGRQGKDGVLVDDVGSQLRIEFDVEMIHGDGMISLSLHTAHWIVNHTDLDLVVWMAGSTPIAAPGQGYGPLFCPSDLYLLREPASDHGFIIESLKYSGTFVGVPSGIVEEIVTMRTPRAGDQLGQGLCWTFVDSRLLLKGAESDFCLDCSQREAVPVLAVASDSRSQRWQFFKQPDVDDRGVFVNAEGRCLEFRRNGIRIIDHDRSGKASHCRLLHEDRFFLEASDFDPPAKEEGDDEEEEGEEGAKLAEGKDSDPIVFSFPEGADQRLMISVNKSDLSTPFKVDNVARAGNLVVVSEGREYDVGVIVNVAPGRFSRTKIITFSSRFRIANLTKKTISVRQTESEFVQTLAPEVRSNFYWADAGSDTKTLQVTIDGDQYDWCTPIDLMQGLGQHYIKLTPKETGWIHVLSLTLQQSGGTVFVFVEDPDFFPYVILNELTEETVSVTQSKVNKWSPILPKSKIRFCWDDSSLRQLVDVKINGFQVASSFNLNRVHAKRATHAELRPKRYNLRLLLQGPTKVLVIEEFAGSRRGAGGVEVDVLEQDGKEKSDETEMLVFANLPAIGLSVVNSRSQEVIYLSLEGIHVKFEQTNKHQFVNFHVESFQLDDQSSEDAVIPVVMYHAVDLGKPFINFTLSRVIGRNQFHYFGFCMQELNLCVDIAFIKRVIDLVSLFAGGDEAEEAEAMLKTLPEPAVESSNALSFYFEEFVLHALRINLTFKYSASTEEEEGKSKNPLMQVLDTLGFTLINTEGAPLRFKSLALDHPFMTIGGLTSSIKKHYIKEGTRELYKILGSLDVIGNPIGLFSDVGTGFKELFYDPFAAVTKNPKDVTHLGGDVARGASSLVGKTIHGAFDSSSKIAKTLGKGIGALTFDKEFINEQQKHQRKPTNLVEGLKEGGTQFFRALWGGVSGPIAQPIKGARNRGFVGFLGGLGKGIVGIPTKPTVGIFEFLARTQEGISAMGQEQITRRRCIRTFRVDGAVVRYDPVHCFMQFLLRNVDSPLHADIGDERAVIFVDYKDHRLLMLTDGSVSLLKRTGAARLQVVWRLRFGSIVQVQPGAAATGAARIVYRKKGFLGRERDDLYVDLPYEHRKRESLSRLVRVLRELVHPNEVEEEVGES